MTTPFRQPTADRLAVFLGDWTAEGTSYGGTDQSGADPRANGVPWTSSHTGRWHTGEHFLIQDERARPGGEVFDTISVMGVDQRTGAYFARCFENHGYSRSYHVEVDDDTWVVRGPTERATITFSDGGRRQDIVWEWKPDDSWLPLCDRTAIRRNERTGNDPGRSWAR